MELEGPRLCYRGKDGVRGEEMVFERLRWCWGVMLLGGAKMLEMQSWR